MMPWIILLVLTTMLVAIAGFGGVGDAVIGIYKALFFIFLFFFFLLLTSSLPHTHAKSQPDE